MEIPVTQIDRLDEFDKPGEHLWIVSGVWKVDPQKCFDPQNPVLLDQENIIALQGPGCFKCEEHYRVQMLKQPCRGSVKLM